MPNDARAPDSRRTSRRTLLRLVGGLAAGAGVATTAGAESDQSAYTLSQGDRTVAVEPLSGEIPVERLYDYRLPDRYDGHGDTSADSGPNYGSVGTTDLQRESTTVTFLYDGPNGLSLVVVHDTGSQGRDDGGAATWDLVVRPANVEWLVKDDLYVDAQSGERVESNFDNWDTNGTTHTIDWVWSAGATDGGVLGYLKDQFALSIDPSYNEAAALWTQQYAGEIDDWQFLSGNPSDPQRVSLSLDEQVTLTGPAADRGPHGGSEAGTDHGNRGDDDARPEDDIDEERAEQADETREEREEKRAEEREAENERDESEGDEEDGDGNDGDEEDRRDEEDDGDDDGGRGPDGEGPPGHSGGGPPGHGGGGPPGDH